MYIRKLISVLQTGVAALLLLALGSCASEVIKSNPYDDIILYPPPPDTTRVQYLTSISSSSDIVAKQTALKKFLYGEEVPKPIIKPYGITVKDSRLYICDSGLGGLVIIDLSDNSFEYFTPGGRGLLQLPLNCAVDNNNFLYIADGNRRQIVVFDEKGKYNSEFGILSDTFKPTDVAILNNSVYVASVKDQKIYVYNKETRELSFRFPDTEPGDDGYLYQPTNLFVDNNFIYVSDMGDNTVKRYDLKGNYISSIGGSGNMPGNLMRPKGLTVDDKGNLFIVDAAFENVQIFNKEGQVLMFFGGTYNRHGDMWLPADVTISYSGLEYFGKFVDESFDLKYLILVTNQYGPDKISVYGFVEPKKVSFEVNKE